MTQLFDQVDTRYANGVAAHYANEMAKQCGGDAETWYPACQKFVQDNLAYHEGNRHTFTPMPDFMGLILGNTGRLCDFYYSKKQDAMFDQMDITKTRVPTKFEGKLYTVAVQAGTTPTSFDDFVKVGTGFLKDD